MKDAPIIPRHQWTHNGAEVLILKCVDKSGITHGGFQWPLTVGAEVVAPDFTMVAECGGGLHGWPWGLAIGDGKDPEWAATWIVFGSAPADVIDLGGKVKTRSGIIRYIGEWIGATAFVLSGQMAWVHQAAQGASSATGYSSASSATGYSSASSATGYSSASSATGYRSASSATGDRSASSATGDSSASSATGYRSASSATGCRSASSATGESSASSATGDSSASSATGDSSASSATGDASAAVVTGLNARAQVGAFGVLALGWWNAAESRYEMRCARVGLGDGSDGLLKSQQWYRLDETTAEFVEDRG